MLPLERSKMNRSEGMKTTQLITSWALRRCSHWRAECLQSSDEAPLLMSPLLKTVKDISIIESCCLLPGGWAEFTHVRAIFIYTWMSLHRSAFITCLKHWAVIWRMGGVVSSVVCCRDLCKGGGGESWVMQSYQCWIQQFDSGNSYPVPFQSLHAATSS